MKKIVVLCKGELEKSPPVMTVARVLRELNMEVTVICSISDHNTKANFKALGITILDMCPESPKSALLPAKVVHWRRFRVEAWKAVGKLGDIDLLWVGSVDAALALGRPLLRRRFVLHARELYDTSWVYRHLMKRYVRRAAAVVVCEYIRACIFRCWYDLKETPFVLPNKPAHHPRRLNLDIENDRARDIMLSLGDDEKIVLYQGGIRPYSDLRFVAKAVQNLGNGWRFVVMGSGRMDYLKTLKSNYPSLIHIPRVTAPFHLQITSHAYIGVATYAFTCLNNIFCAPNKTWESTGFGLPVLCNDIPALRSEIQANGAGLCVDIRDSGKIGLALKKIDENYAEFSHNATRLFDSVDGHGIIQSIIDDAVLDIETKFHKE